MICSTMHNIWILFVLGEGSNAELKRLIMIILRNGGNVHQHVQAM
jgi:hypothetical protein